MTVKKAKLKGNGIGTKVFKTLSDSYRRNFCNGKARPLYDGEYHIPCHNFSGPGTILNEYTLSYPPYNNIDNCSRTHDIAYDEAFKENDETKRKQMIREADIKALECYDKFKNEQGYNLAKLGILGKVKAEQYLPSGITSKIFGKWKGGIKGQFITPYSKKNKKDLPKQVKEGIKLISFNYNEAVPFGTYTYNVSPYPSDIDILELVFTTKNKIITIKDVNNKLKRIIRNILKKGWYIPEIKAGLDNRYMINIGVYNRNVLNGYNPKYIKEELQKLYSNKLINNNEYKELNNIVVNNINRENWEKLYNSLRNLWLLRWTPQEVLKGFKLLHDGTKKLFIDALNDKTMVKIDVWALLNNKYIELTNFFIIGYTDNKGKTQLINFDSNKLTNMTVELKEDIEDRYYSINNYNPMKLIKRMWTLSRMKKDEEILYKLTPLLSSGFAKFAKVLSDIKMIKEMYKNIDKPPKLLINQLEYLKDEISYINDVKINQTYLYNIIDEINKTNNNDKKIVLLDNIINYIKPIINYYAEQALIRVSLLPPPADYLP